MPFQTGEVVDKLLTFDKGKQDVRISGADQLLLSIVSKNKTLTFCSRGLGQVSLDCGVVSFAWFNDVVFSKNLEK